MLIRRQQGFTLVEFMIAVVILAIALTLALPSFEQWMRDARTKTTADTLASGLQIARAEAVRRNTTVVFQLVDTLDENCAYSAGGAQWVVSLFPAEGMCDVAPDPATVPAPGYDAAAEGNPIIIQKKSSAEGGRDVTVSTTPDGATHVTFNSLGRVVAVNPDDASAPIAQIDVGWRDSEGVEQGAKLGVVIGSGGSVKLCDRAITDPDDARYCSPL